MHRSRRRLIGVLSATIIIFIALLLRLALIQVVHGPAFGFSAFKQQAEVTALEEYRRGGILDRNGVSLTGQYRAKEVALFPVLIDNKEVAAERLSGILHVPSAEIKEKMQGAPCLLLYPLNEEQAEAVDSAGWPGIEVVPVECRYGPDSLAEHVVGSLGKIDSVSRWRRLNEGRKPYALEDSVGKTGCEYFYEHILKGTVPLAAAGIYHDARGEVLKGLGIEIREQTDNERADLLLTIDAEVQRTVEEVMDRRVPRGAVVVLEAGGGDILAAASRPAYSTGNGGAAGKPAGEESFLNRAFTPFPPGSVFKLVVGAAALETGLIKTQTRFPCTGSDRFVNCWNPAGHGEITFDQAFAYSCNPSFARIGLALGKERLIEYCRLFALEDRSALGYPLSRDPRQDLSRFLKPHNLVNLSVGQGPILMTPVQVASVLNTVINDGIFVRPRLAKALRWPQGGEELPRDAGKRVLSADTALRLRQAMVLATTAGTGRRGYLDDWGSAGKTGTAEVSGNGACAWFAGYAPLARPRYVIVVMVEGDGSGGSDAAPVFKEIAEKLLS
ncbi:MAG: penicillin-binding transpeptidase domain-containing protein [Bacillota bacterium]